MPGRRIATVLMLDVVGSTHVAAELGDARYRALSTRFDRIVRESLRRFGGKEEDHAGDGFFATFPQPDRAIRSAVAISDAVRELGIEIRAGIHTGQTEDQGGKAQGIAVVIGARVMSLAEAGEILATSTTKELVTGSGYGFEDLSAHELKGVPGTWQVFAVMSVDAEPRAPALPAAVAAARRGAIVPLTGRERPRHSLAWVAAGATLLAAIVFAAVATRDAAPTRPLPPGDAGPPVESVVRVDPGSGAILDTISAPVQQRGIPGSRAPTWTHPFVVGQGGVWTLREFRALYHIDPVRGELRSRIPLETGRVFSLNLAEGADAIWVAYPGGLIEVKPATDEQRVVLPFSRRATPNTNPLTSVDVAVGGGFVWLGTSEGSLIRYDPDTGDHVALADLDPIDTIAFGHGAVWAVDIVGGEVIRYDAASMRPIATIPVDAGVDAIVSGDTAVWALSRNAGVLTEIDVAANETHDVVQVGKAPTGLAAGDGTIWVGDEDGVIRRVDEDTRRTQEIPFGPKIRALAFDDETGTLWVDVAGPF